MYITPWNNEDGSMIGSSVGFRVALIPEVSLSLTNLDIQNLPKICHNFRSGATTCTLKIILFQRIFEFNLKSD